MEFELRHQLQRINYALHVYQCSAKDRQEILASCESDKIIREFWFGKMLEIERVINMIKTRDACNTRLAAKRVSKLCSSTDIYKAIAKAIAEVNY